MAINYGTSIQTLYATNVGNDTAYTTAVPAARRNQTAEQKMLTLIEVTRAYMATLASDDEARKFHYVMSRMLAGVANNFAYDDLTVRAIGNNPDVKITAAGGDTVSVTTSSGTDAVVLRVALIGTSTTVATNSADGDTLTVTTVSGTDTITLDDAPYVSVAALVADINSQLSNVDEAEAYDAGSGRLGFRNSTGNNGVAFTLGLGGGTDSVLTNAGIAAGTYTGGATIADLVRNINIQLDTATQVEAYNAGGKLGFRNTTGNLGVSFTLADGAGASLLSKAGIAPGTYLNPVEKIANAARDDALSHFTRAANPIVV